jgi:hypothetical protein
VSCVVRTAVHAVKADHVATFLGRQLTGAYVDALGDDFHTRVKLRELLVIPSLAGLLPGQT